MRKLCFSLLLMLTAVVAAQADEIAFFNFNASSPTPTTPAVASRGVGTATTNNVGATTFGGTTVNARQPADSPTTGNLAFAAVGGTNNVNNGSNITFNVSTVGFSGTMISFATQRTGTGFNNNQFQYSTDGTNFINFGSTFNPPTAFTGTGGLQMFDLSGITGLNNNLSAAFRIVFNGATTAAGNIRIDNFAVDGSPITQAAPVPEPATMLLLGTGLTGVIGAVRRRRKTL